MSTVIGGTAIAGTSTSDERSRSFSLDQERTRAVASGAWTELDPALAATIAAIPEWDGLEPEVTPITIGITNRNFRVDIGGESFVVRLSGKDTDLLGIDRAAENEAASAAARAGVAPEVFAYLRSGRR